MSDASEVMDLLLKTHTEGEQLPVDDPQTSYLISAWSRICRIMGKKFAQYLPMVMEPVMRTAAMKPEVALLDNEDLESIEGDLDWHFVTLGEQQNFGIKTAGKFFDSNNTRTCTTSKIKLNFCPSSTLLGMRSFPDDGIYFKAFNQLYTNRPRHRSLSWCE